MKTITYNIQKNNINTWIIWKEIQTKHGYGCYGIFQGTKKECEEKLKELR